MQFNFIKTYLTIKCNLVALLKPKLQKDAKDKKVMFVCKTSNYSGVVTQLARTRNIDALSLILDSVSFLEARIPPAPSSAPKLKPKSRRISKTLISISHIIPPAKLF